VSNPSRLFDSHRLCKFWIHPAFHGGDDDQDVQHGLSFLLHVAVQSLRLLRRARQHRRESAALSRRVPSARRQRASLCTAAADIQSDKVLFASAAAVPSTAVTLPGYHDRLALLIIPNHGVRPHCG